ncbi:MAG: hypothetical protein HC859_05210 [Bacteroidia bacterium]|nr:hypothetical protein [Bacteroidia bacterium]
MQKFSDENFTIIPLKEEGLALIREKNDFKEGDRLWQFKHLDNQLSEKKDVELAINPRNHIIGYEYTQGLVSLLFRAGESNRSDILLWDISLTDYGIQQYEIQPELNYQITHFSRVGSHIVFGGYVNNEPAVLLYNTLDKQMKVLPGFFQKDMELVDLRVNANNTFNTVLIDRSVRDEGRLIFRTFDESGEQLLEDVVAIEKDRTLQVGITSMLEREDLVLLGTWGIRNSKTSTGFFALVVNPFEEQSINFVSFGELSHFTDYMKTKRAERIKDKTRFELKEGRIPSYTATVMPYRLAENKTGFLLLAEAYQSSSNLNNYPYSNPYGSPFYNPYWSGGFYPYSSRWYTSPYAYGNRPATRPTEDIRPYESVVACFDSQGKLLWDQSFSIELENKLPGVIQVSEFHYSGDEVVFMYKDESEIKSRTVPAGGGGEPMEEGVPVRLTEDLDEVRSEDKADGGVKHWYGDNHYFVWGYQTIRNNTKDDRVRNVFYINKITIE